MKKHYFLFFALLAAPLWAAPNSATVDFLQKLNGYYYCLSREGLKDYRCSLTCSLTPESEKALKAQGILEPRVWGAMRDFHFRVMDAAGSPISIEGSPAAKTGDPSLDGQVEKLEQAILESLRGFFQSWKGLVVEVLNEPADIAQGKIRFHREANGFKVLQGDPATGEVEGTFDMKGKLLEMSLPGEDGEVSLKPRFTYTKKGYLFQGLTMTTPQVQQAFALAYGVQGRYWLPRAMTARLRLKGLANTDIELIFGFTDYRVEP
ncbi:MAG TPA: hypothetical protein VHE12_11885 [bacterium]|nr:hypothetical protein [bacterium]